VRKQAMFWLGNRSIRGRSSIVSRKKSLALLATAFEWSAHGLVRCPFECVMSARRQLNKMSACRQLHLSTASSFHLEKWISDFV